MSIKLLTEQHLEFLSLTGGSIGSSESTLVKMPHCRKSHVTPQRSLNYFLNGIDHCSSEKELNHEASVF